jgi:hypothetical protein
MTSSVVEHSLHHPKVNSLSPAAAFGTGWEGKEMPKTQFELTIKAYL